MKNPEPIPKSRVSNFLFARAGIPFPLILSRRLIEHYRLPESELCPERIEVAWVVRSILNGCLPSRMIETQHGPARLAAYNCLDHPEGERRLAVIASPNGKTIHVMLPEELSIPMTSTSATHL